MTGIYAPGNKSQYDEPDGWEKLDRDGWEVGSRKGTRMFRTQGECECGCPVIWDVPRPVDAAPIPAYVWDDYHVTCSVCGQCSVSTILWENGGKKTGWCPV